ncbi:MAG TPA: hypothetical protein VKG38_04170 [Solirubrobacteraceae bacterium]|nr:hypothetical protein [Solirubrobacteraceae bacterium]
MSTTSTQVAPDQHARNLATARGEHRPREGTNALATDGVLPARPLLDQPIPTLEGSKPSQS